MWFLVTTQDSHFALDGAQICRQTWRLPRRLGVGLPKFSALARPRYVGHPSMGSFCSVELKCRRLVVGVRIVSKRRHFYQNINKSSAVAELGDRLVTIDMGRKVGEGCCAPFRGGDGSPSNTMSPDSKRTSVPSGILIHPTV